MDIEIPKQYKFLFSPRRYKVAYSGRGAGKSYAFALTLLILGLQKNLKILCAREFQTSIKDSVYALLLELNETYNFGYTFTNNEITHPKTGTTFVFYGLARNIDSIKSLASIDICWVEEASTISQTSLDKLLPTIRKADSEIWFSFNPDSANDAVYKMFVTPTINELVDSKIYADQQHHILFTNYKNNRFLSKTLLNDINKLKKTNYKKYLHVYGGNVATANTNAIIQPEWFDAAINAHTKLNIKIKGERVIGFDPADTGNDTKAYVERHGILIKSINEWTDGDLEEAVEKVYDAAVLGNVKDIVYDSIGVGVGAKVKFNSYDPQDTINKTGFVGSAKVDKPTDKYKDSLSNKEMFRNKRAQYYWLLADRFEATYRAVVHHEYIEPDMLISIDPICENIEELKAELTQIRRKKSSTTAMIQIESKDDIKARGLPSPGIADSLMYVFAELSEKFSVPNINITYSSEW